MLAKKDLMWPWNPKFLATIHARYWSFFSIESSIFFGGTQYGPTYGPKTLNHSHTVDGRDPAPPGMYKTL